MYEPTTSQYAASLTKTRELVMIATLQLTRIYFPTIIYL